MARIRTIKPEFWTSEQIAECSITARLLFIGIWNFSDDYGVHPDSAKRLKMEVFPADDLSLDDINGLLGELVTHGLLTRYEVDGKPYLAVTGWNHQKIEKPSKKYPSPPSLRTVDDQSATGSPRNGVESSLRESNSIDRLGERSIDWAKVRGECTDLKQKLSPDRRLNARDRSTTIRAAAVAQLHLRPDALSVAVSKVHDKIKLGNCNRPFAYFQTVMKNLLTEAGLNAHAEWDSVAIPPDLAQPPPERVPP